MKHIFPKVKPRRLGQRGNSRYCYSGLRKKVSLTAPSLPDLSNLSDFFPNGNNDSFTKPSDTSATITTAATLNGGTSGDDDDKDVLTSSMSLTTFPNNNNSVIDDGTSCHTGGVPSRELVQSAAQHLIIEWAEKQLEKKFSTIKDLSRYLIECGLVDKSSFAAIALISSSEDNGRHLVITSDSKSSRNIGTFVSKKLNHKGTSNKEPKKKVDRCKSTSNSSTYSTQNGSKNRLARRVLSNSSSTSCQVDTNSNCKSIESSFSSKLETEKNDIKLVEIGHNGNSSSLLQGASPTNKIEITRASSSSHIIVLPNVSPVKVSATCCLSQPISDTSGSQSVQAPASSSPNKPVTLKYKRIQPKPVSYSSHNGMAMGASLSYSNAGTDNGTINYCESFKRRESATLPVSYSEMRESSSSSSSSSTSNHGDRGLGKSQTKRHHEACKEIIESSSKKRLLASVDGYNDSISYSKSTTLDSLSSAETLRSGGTNSIASLSPVLQSQSKCYGNITSSTEMCIKLQELECDALADDLNDNGNSNLDSHHDSNSSKLSQLRLLLEKNLPRSKNCMNGEDKVIPTDQGKSFDSNLECLMSIKYENQEANEMNRIVSSTNNSSNVANTFIDTRYISNKGNHKSNCDLTSSSSLLEEHINFDNVGDCISAQTQIPSVPASPNARRQAFSFQPISQRITPTIPENNTVLYTNTFANMQQGPSPQYNPNQRSIGVGLSQPPSSANSPFVSPRDTPVPLTRSRHDSGQSNYSTSRQTPYPVIDSGLSSISSSPFISPQSTPVPLSRMRASSNNINSFNGSYQRGLVNRARHSSGPGNSFSSIPPNIKNFMRSSSVSPLITQNGDMSMNGNAIGLNTHPSNHSSMNSSLSTNSTPMSPSSEPLSPSNALTMGDNLSSSELSLGHHSESILDSGFSSRDWLNSVSSSQSVQSSYSHSTNNNHVRQRHFSSPYATYTGNYSNNTINTNNNSTLFRDSTHSSEVQNLFKDGNYSESISHESSERPQLSRCHSVPVQRQMITTSCNGYLVDGSTDMIMTPPTVSSLEMSPDSEHSTASKSYPQASVCNSNFLLPSSPSTINNNSANKLSSAIQEDNNSTHTFIEGRHDVMVSGLQSKDWSSGEVNAISDEVDLNMANDQHSLLAYGDARRVTDESISSSAPLEDLGTTLQDLHDCDNDFSFETFELGVTSNAIGEM
ncbi:uncharacterized protein LOC141853705 isoform X2 [Brevipalpus obovatus]